MKTLEQLGISPTPWKQGEWDPYREDSIIFCNYHRKNGTPSSRIIASCNAAFSSEQARIDAHLIAAAPDLYEALREAIIEMCHDCPNCGAYPKYACKDQDCKCFPAKWRAALAKAAGESEARNEQGSNMR